METLREPEYVWYASYGSNMCIERFLCYIRGGAVDGMQGTCLGCADKTLPLKSKRVMLPHELYFSETSPFWGGGGVAFLNPTPSVHHSSHCRLYLISRDQFKEVVAQENRYSHVSPFTLTELTAKKKIKISSGWYSLVMYLGDLEGHPIFTFTSEHSLEPDGSTSGHHSVPRELNCPSIHYLTVISVGLQQMGLSSSDILQYYFNVKGIKTLASNSFLLGVLQNSEDFQKKYEEKYLYKLLTQESNATDNQFSKPSKHSVSSSTLEISTTFDNWDHLLTVSLECHQYEHVYTHSFTNQLLKPKLCRSQHDMTS